MAQIKIASNVHRVASIVILSFINVIVNSPFFNKNKNKTRL